MSRCVRKFVSPVSSPPLSPLSGFLLSSRHELSQRCFSATLAVETEGTVRPISEVPGPKSFPIVGSLLSVLLWEKGLNIKRAHIFWENMTSKYGPISKYKFPGTPPLLVLTRPDDIEKVYRATMDNPIRVGFSSLKKVRYEAAENYFNNKGGLLVENDEEWWRVRSKVQTPMMKPKNLVKYIHQMDEVTLDFIERIVDFQEKFGEMPCNFQQELYKWALESVSLVALNRRLGCLNPDLPSNSSQMQLINVVNSIFEHLNATEMTTHWWALFPTPAFRKLKKGHDLFVRIADAHMREAEAELIAKHSHGESDPQEMTLLETLLQKEGLSRTDVMTVILDMLFAGIDTTSHTLAFTLYLLARNAEAQKRLQEEVDSVLGEGKGPITENHLARLSFLKACIKESLRLFPLTLGNARVLTQDMVLSGYYIPKGYQAFVLNMVTSKDETLFSRAKEFLPERWGRDQPLGPIHPFASLPFSHGPRMCIGRRIAEQEMYIFLARAMHRFNVSYKYKDIELITRMVSVPSEPLKFEFMERR